MTYRSRMIDKLTTAFAPTFLEVIDESEDHHGHGGHHAEGETHFLIRIAAPAFAGTSRLQRHRMINEVLRQELAERVHALSIEADPS
ncbi:MAG: BolA family transcriptional regulator [Phyllobacteriaceae bacterium]|nr:BolA family transcriptional regulator [Phyllobacteriaceae bacterium]